jgi:hypothetical protein
MNRRIEIRDEGATLTVWTVDDFGERLSVSVPSGRLAGYPEARRSSLAEAIAEVRKHAAAAQRVYGDVEVVGDAELDAADPESLVGTW